MTNLARFIIEGSVGGVSPSTDGGYDAVHEEEIAFRLESAGLLYGRRYSIEVYSPDAPLSPRATKDAPLLSLVGATTGQNVNATTLSADVTTEIPDTGVHTWIVRCKVNGGVDNNGDPHEDYVFERIIAIRSTAGVRKILATEATQYDEHGWAEAYNELVDLLEEGGEGESSETHTSYESHLSGSFGAGGAPSTAVNLFGSSSFTAHVESDSAEWNNSTKHLVVQPGKWIVRCVLNDVSFSNADESLEGSHGLAIAPSSLTSVYDGTGAYDPLTFSVPTEDSVALPLGFTLSRVVELDEETSFSLYAESTTALSCTGSGMQGARWIVEPAVSGGGAKGDQGEPGESGGTPSDATPAPVGTATAGTSDEYARGDHAHAFASQADQTVLANTSGSSAAPSAVAPQTLIFRDATSGAGNIRMQVAPTGYGAITSLDDEDDVDVVLTLPENGRFTITVTVLVKLASAGTYREVGAVVSGTRAAGTLTLDGDPSDLNLGSNTSGILLTLSATGGGLNVNVANTTGEAVDGRVHAGWKIEDLIT